MQINKNPVKVELDLKGYWNQKKKQFCKAVGENDNLSWEDLLVKPLTTRYGNNLKLESIEQTPNKIIFRVTLTNRETTENAVYSIVNRYLEINKDIIMPEGLSVEQEIPVISVH